MRTPRSRRSSKTPARRWILLGLVGAFVLILVGARFLGAFSPAIALSNVEIITSGNLHSRPQMTLTLQTQPNKKTYFPWNDIQVTFKDSEVVAKRRLPYTGDPIEVYSGNQVVLEFALEHESGKHLEKEVIKLSGIQVVTYHPANTNLDKRIAQFQAFLRPNDQGRVNRLGRVMRKKTGFSHKDIAEVLDWSHREATGFFRLREMQSDLNIPGVR